jgi:hypothetical protein
MDFKVAIEGGNEAAVWEGPSWAASQSGVQAEARAGIRDSPPPARHRKLRRHGIRTLLSGGNCLEHKHTIVQRFQMCFVELIRIIAGQITKNAPPEEKPTASKYN